MRKEYPNSKLAALTPEQADQLEEFCDKTTLAKAVKYIHDELGIDLTDGTLSAWLQNRRQARVQQEALGQVLSRIDAAAAASSQIKAAIVANRDQLFDSLQTLIGQEAFNRSMRGEELDVKSMAIFNEIALGGLKVKTDTKKIAQKDQEIALKEAKFQRDTCDLFVKWCANETAKQIVSSTGNNADKIEQLGKLMFGEAWR